MPRKPKIFYLNPITYLNDCARRSYIKNYERAGVFSETPQPTEHGLRPMVGVGRRGQASERAGASEAG